MKRKPVVLREQARRDIGEAVAHYRLEAGPAVALAFIDAVDKACGHVGEQPAGGSPRYAHELDIPGLRFRAVIICCRWTARGISPHRRCIAIVAAT